MILSMTGFGRASASADQATVFAEVRTLNSRYLKLSMKTPEGCSVYESGIDKLVREHVSRGTVQVMIRIQRESCEDDYKLNLDALQSYVNQLSKFSQEHPIRPELFLALPGVVVDAAQAGRDPMADWSTVEKALRESLVMLMTMRSDEGRAMKSGLESNCSEILKVLATIEQRVPVVLTAYRDRLLERVRALLNESGATIEPSDVVREVSVFAERSDISEEIVRLRSHVEQFQGVLDEPKSNGRKLEFLTQEMFREANTIGSKSGDTEISKEAVDLKGTIEKIREMVQNIE